MSERNDSAPAEHVVPRVDEARLARQWGVVAARLDSRKRRAPWWLAVGAAGALVAAVTLAVAPPWRTTGSTAAMPVRSAASAQVAVGQIITLPDGSLVTLEPYAQLQVERADPAIVHLVLESGAIELEVTHREGRSFVVTAGGHDVVVVGTHFRVERATERSTLTVAVERGLVRVEGPSGTHLLGAGEKWTTTRDSTVASNSAPLEDAGAAATEPSSSSLPSPPAEGARELLVRATEARAAGRYRDAAVALDTIRRRYRADPRAGLAAFELGRLRLDILGDPVGANEAFADAIALAPRATFREDAEARRVESLDATGNVAACGQARDAYLGRYPAGIHVRQVSMRCRAR